MDEGSNNFQTKQSTLATTQMASLKVAEHINGQTEKYTTGNGIKDLNMDLDYGKALKMTAISENGNTVKLTATEFTFG